MKTFTQYLEEAHGIKGWKHAHSDLAKIRRAAAEGEMEHKLVSLKKDGNESKMHDATKHFRSEEEARRYHDNIKHLNPNRSIRHNYYVNGKLKEVLE